MDINRPLANTSRPKVFLPGRELVIDPRTTTTRFNIELAEFLVTAVIIALLVISDLVVFGMIITTPNSAPVQELQSAPTR